MPDRVAPWQRRSARWRRPAYARHCARPGGGAAHRLGCRCRRSPAPSEWHAAPRARYATRRAPARSTRQAARRRRHIAVRSAARSPRSAPAGCAPVRHRPTKRGRPARGTPQSPDCRPESPGWRAHWRAVPDRRAPARNCARPHFRRSAARSHSRTRSLHIARGSPPPSGGSRRTGRPDSLPTGRRRSCWCRRRPCRPRCRRAR